MGELEELRNTVAKIFRHKRRETMTEEEFWKTLAFDLAFFGPRDAPKLLDAALRAGFVTREEDGRIRPRFDVEALQIPLDFHPSQRALTATPGPGTLLKVVTEVAVRRNLDRSAVMARVSAVQQEMGIDGRAAALLIAAEEGIRLPDETAAAEAEILGERRAGTPAAPAAGTPSAPSAPSRGGS